MLQSFGAEMPPSPALDHVRMHLHHHRAVGMLSQGRLEHLLETLRPRQSQGDREVSCRLVHHQHKALLRGRRLPRRIQLAQPLGAPQPLHRLGPGELLVTERCSDPLLQTAWGGGIEMHPQVIHQQTERWVATPLGQRPQQTVLQMPDRQATTLGEPLHTSGTGPPPPGQQRIHIATPARQELRRSHKCRQRLVREHSGLRNPQPVDHRVRRGTPNPHR